MPSGLHTIMQRMADKREFCNTVSNEKMKCLTWPVGPCTIMQAMASNGLTCYIIITENCNAKPTGPLTSCITLVERTAHKG
jgi:hypothetical protein